MKILPVEKIREADAYTILHEPIADIDLMERAAMACFYWLIKNVSHDRQVLVFCGTGNNGGDGLAIARMMAQKGYRTRVYITGPAGKLSPGARINLERLQQVSHVTCSFIKEKSELPAIDPASDILIDALFGSGLSKEIKGFPAAVIGHINSSKAVTIAIDVPSGLYCDLSVKSLRNPAIVRADHTLTFAPPKLCFFFPENNPYAGQWHLLDIGILEEFIEQASTKNFYTDREEVRRILKPRNKFAHKGHFGHALLFCGSKGKMGAAVLAARGCIRSGAGLTSLHVPQSGNTILQTAVPGAMLVLDPEADILTSVPDLSSYSAIGAGPGIGQDMQTQKMIKLLIQNAAGPLVMDADALNILGENKTWIGFVPKGSIFTPHPREFERIAGKSSDDFDRNHRQREFSVKYGVYVVLKGAFTAISTPEGRCWFNSTGNPGMATGGSGDVLTGMITGLLAQGYTPFESCLLGAYLHGLAGDLAAESLGYEALMADDIIDNTGKAFRSLYGEL